MVGRILLSSWVSKYVTVSVNEEFIESGSFADRILHEGDEVEFLYFMGGGK